MLAGDPVMAGTLVTWPFIKQFDESIRSSTPGVVSKKVRGPDVFMVDMTSYHF